MMQIKISTGKKKITSVHIPIVWISKEKTDYIGEPDLIRKAVIHALLKWAYYSPNVC